MQEIESGETRRQKARQKRSRLDFSDPVKRLWLSFLVVVVMFFIGTFGYLLLGHGEWSFINCAYMTVITLATVGYGEVVDLSHNPAGRVFTMFLIISGMGSIMFFISTMTAFIVEGALRDILRRKRMEKTMDRMNHHVIVCGLGETGLHVAEELSITRTPFIMIDKDEARLKIVSDLLGGHIPFLDGDASDDDVLRKAGIGRAYGVIACCAEDKDNLFIIVSAKQLNPAVRVVARASNMQSEAKFSRAGADRVVTTNLIGGLRLASEMLRPAVTTFLDRMIRDRERSMRVDEVPILAQSPFVGATLGSLEIRKTMHLSIIAVQTQADHEKKYVYNPDESYRLQAGDALICIGEIDEFNRLRALAAQANS